MSASENENYAVVNHFKYKLQCKLIYITKKKYVSKIYLLSQNKNVPKLQAMQYYGDETGVNCQSGVICNIFYDINLCQFNQWLTYNSEIILNNDKQTKLPYNKKDFQYSVFNSNLNLASTNKIFQFINNKQQAKKITWKLFQLFCWDLRDHIFIYITEKPFILMYQYRNFIFKLFNSSTPLLNLMKNTLNNLFTWFKTNDLRSYQGEQTLDKIMVPIIQSDNKNSKINRYFNRDFQSKVLYPGTQ